MKVLIIDNYDSFTFNLYQYIGEVLSGDKQAGVIDDFEILVKRNDEIDLAGVKTFAPDRIIISPGPGSPDDASYFGVCAEVIREMGPKTPLLGVCLGMQGIVHVFGGRVVKAPLPMHGKTSLIEHNGEGIFAGIPNRLEIMRYHSLIAEAQTLPECLEVTSAVGNLKLEEFGNRKKIAAGGDFEIMGVKHRQWPIYGIQFHPESFATEGGREMIRNFLYLAP
jgi:anthranilate synthase component 2